MATSWSRASRRSWRARRTEDEDEALSVGVMPDDAVATEDEVDELVDGAGDDDAEGEEE